MLKHLFRYLKKEQTPKLVYVTQEKGFKFFKKKINLITAGGGLVYNTQNQLLLIKRNGIWDLPKGKLEAEEDFKTGALREVEEECNVNALTIVNKLTNSYHLYDDGDTWCLKKTAWYIMQTENWEMAKPQLEEGITDIKWVSNEDLNIQELNTYSSIKTVLRQHLPLRGDI